MKRHLLTVCLYTLVTAFVFGIVYPLTITGIAHLTMRNKADGQIIVLNGLASGSALIGQPFTGPRYFHSRPSAAGTGYDATASAGSNYGPTNKALNERIDASVKAESTGAALPVDLVTASGSGLDPHITPAAASYQVKRVAEERHLPVSEVQKIVDEHITPRQFGLLGEPRVNVLRLNMALDQQPGPTH